MKIAERNVNDFRYADDTTLTAESEEPLDEGERGKREKKKKKLA